jgi:DNA (cytosine-5)-methyltransferase 1
MDIGLHRAGWRTVSFSEIDPYASAILAQRWPGVPNLGDIGILRRVQSERQGAGDDRDAGQDGQSHPLWTDATLWTGGFPCQDLSVAGKRAGLAGERSGLAFAFLDLVRLHRPPALILENVPGLLSSNSGRDLGELFRRLGDLRYGWAYRVLDAQWFGVPQRRRRVFILALDLERYPDDSSAAQVLAVGTRCERDHPQEREAWADAAGGTGRGAALVEQTLGTDGAWGHGSRDEHGLVYNATAAYGAWDGPDDAAGNLSARDYKSSNHLVVDGAPSYPDRMRATDGLVRRVDGGRGVAFAKGTSRPDSDEWDRADVSRTLNTFDTADGRQTMVAMTATGESHDPQGLDSHRYRVIGNGVAAPVAEWIGMRLRSYLDG